MFTLEESLSKEILDILEKRFKASIKINSVVRLSDPERRNLVLRINLNSELESAPKSLIFKQSHRASEATDDTALLERFARDWAGLEFLSSLEITERLTPKFYGASKEYRCVLQEDFGEKHLSLVDTLTSEDNNAAVAALTCYMKSMAQFHANSVKQTKTYTEILKSINPSAKNRAHEFDDILLNTKNMLTKLNLSCTTELEQEMQGVFTMMKDPSAFTTLTHGDICLDNLFHDPIKDTIRFIDFEWGFLGNALTDAAFLRMSMPTGWCVKAFPQKIIEDLEMIYKQELMDKIPDEIESALYDDAYVSACGYWVMIQLAYIMNEVIDQERDISQFPVLDDVPNWKPEDNLKRPQCLYRFQKFIELASQYDKLPHLRSIAEKVLNQLKESWPEAQPLKLFTAFANDATKTLQLTEPPMLNAATISSIGFFKASSLQSKIEQESQLKDFTQTDPYGPGAIIPYQPPLFPK